jgi:hypothetical protein
MSMQERFCEKIEREPGDCWNWTAAMDTKGYGQFYDNGRKMGSHRYSYEMFVGPIPVGLDLDHLCRNRLCCNPAHLEAVSRRENLVRGNTIVAAKVRQTHCIHGHEFTEANVYLWRGRRHCRTCRLAKHRKPA